MRRHAVIAATEHFRLTDVFCAGPQSRRWSAPEPETGHVLVFPRRGVFARRVHGQEVLLDPTMAYLERPGVEGEFNHPTPGGDACTSIALSASLLASLAGGSPDLDFHAVPVGAEVEVALRRIAATSSDTAGEVAERTVDLVASVLASREPRRVLCGRPATEHARRRLVGEARLALHAQPTIGLFELARLVGASPHHLSRLFSAATGRTVSSYRTQLRVRRALDQLAAGRSDLATLAAELGFADHAHLTRAVRKHVGSTPSLLRAELGAQPRSAGGGSM